MIPVSLVKGQKRRDTVKISLDSISQDIKKALKPGMVIIKPNFVSTSVQLAASHADQIRGILDYFKEFYDKKIIIAEASSRDTSEGYKNFSYHRLTKEYYVELLDLNEGPFEKIPILDKKGETIQEHLHLLLLLYQSVVQKLLFLT